MWQLIPAKDRNFVFKTGDKIQARIGQSVQFDISITETKVQIDMPDGSNYDTYHRPSYDLTRGGMSNRIGGIYGMALYLFVPEITAKPAPAGSSMALVHKACRALESTQQFKLVPYDKHDKREYRIEVCSEVKHTVSAIQSKTPLWNVCVIDMLNGTSVYHHVSHISDIHYLDKFFCYLNTGARWPKASSSVPVCPNGAKAIPEKDDVVKSATIKDVALVDDDPEGQYIIWCPTSSRAPQVILKGRKQAKKVASEMAERHGSKFYWARLMGSSEVKVVKTTEHKTL